MFQLLDCGGKAVLIPRILEREVIVLRTVIFGLGKFYKYMKPQLASCPGLEIVAYVDNDKRLWGTCIDGLPVAAPQRIREIQYDTVLIMSTYEEEIYAQLIELGIPESRILPWEVFHTGLLSGTRKVFQGNKNGRGRGEDILIISIGLNYDGGSLAAVYAAMALRDRGYRVTLAASGGNERFIEEIVNEGITVNICPELPYVRDMEWVRQFDVVVINVFQMIQSAVRTRLVRPTLWWIHEPIDVFHDIRLKQWNRIPANDLQNIDIYAVSRIAKDNFNRFYPDRVKKILHYGIPDRNTEKQPKDAGKTRLIFAIIGEVCTRKAQDIFCRAVQKISGDEAEFWMIGYCGNNAFGDEVRKISAGISSIRMLGLLSREEIYGIFPHIDVVVCASREDSLPIVMTEGMMFGKVCITTDATGTADFIRDGQNGFVVPAGDDQALKEKMEWILYHRDRLADIGRNARKTYEQYFSMDVFGANLEKALLETRSQWCLKGEHNNGKGV